MAPLWLFPLFSQTFSASKLTKLAATGKTLFQVLVPILARGKDTPSNLVRVIVPQFDAWPCPYSSRVAVPRVKKEGPVVRGPSTGLTGRHVTRQVSLRGTAESEFSFDFSFSSPH